MWDQEIAAQHQMNVWAKIRDCGAAMGCAGQDRIGGAGWDMPTKIQQGGEAMGCTSQDKQ